MSLRDMGMAQTSRAQLALDTELLMVNTLQAAFDLVVEPIVR